MEGVDVAGIFVVVGAPPEGVIEGLETGVFVTLGLAADLGVADGLDVGVIGKGVGV